MKAGIFKIINRTVLNILLFILFNTCSDISHREYLEDMVKGPEIRSFTSTLSTLNIAGTVNDSTSLIVDATDNGGIESYYYEIVSGEGTLIGPDTADGKIFMSGSIYGQVTLRVTVTDLCGNSSKKTLTIIVSDPSIPVIHSFTSAYNVILIDGAVKDNTPLNVVATDDAGITAYSYALVSGGGTLTGPDTATGKIYNAGSNTGNVVIRVTVYDIAGNTAEETLTIKIIEKGYQKISDTQGGFGGGLKSGDLFGMSVCSLGDLDGDGVIDIAVGASKDDGNGGIDADRGAVWILFLNEDGTVKSEQKIGDGAGGFNDTLNNEDYFGVSVANLGDLNNDGFLELAVGANRDDDSDDNSGAVWILSINSSGIVQSEIKICEGSNFSDATLNTDDEFGVSISNIGDLNNDGNIDLAVGAIGHNNGNYRGSVWILFLSQSGAVSSYLRINNGSHGVISLNDDDFFGRQSCLLGDLNGDGTEDIVVAAPKDDTNGKDSGAFYVLFLNSSGSVNNAIKIDDLTGLGITLAGDDRFGSSIANLGDLDNDGVIDIAVGARREDTSLSDDGAIYIIFFNSNGTIKDLQTLSNIEAGCGLDNLTPPFPSSTEFGRSCANIGDMNGDGINDIVVGAELDDDGGADCGAVWILFLDTDGTVLH